MSGVLFVTDPLVGLQGEIDASVGLMGATQDLGLDVWCCGPEELAVVDGRVCAHARRIRLRPRVASDDHRWIVDPTWWDELGTAVVDVASFEVVHLRIDPPVDARYLHTTYLLDLVEQAGTRVINRPEGIRAMHEKLVALQFPELCPPTYVGADPQALRSFVRRVGTAVVKPVDGFAGIGVWIVRDDRSAIALLESATHGGRRHVIAQQFLPTVAQGNKRLFLLDGEIVGAVLRRPAADDFRIGPPVAPADIDDHDRAIVGALGPVLREHGLVIAGLDVIDGRLIEVNVTCPGGMHKTDALLGTNLSHTIVSSLFKGALV
ncbi:glutathione synthase [Kribbella sindirgiensis]|uniref:Glutathione synthetase n=1 Tax=Kribbella sindirgiensis TaxID=1124744 RepID=A0A4R0IPF9_9ACTN|nr:glutathione synthase [Kribbella sindirgiensis]TCC34869.1 glutathione synthase [Kribbella sindirgiensis]